MKNIRLGNDIAITWTLQRVDGELLVLDRSSVSLYLVSPLSRVSVDDFSVDGNQVHWTFFGKDQKYIGKYSLIVSINEGVEGMMTTDECNVFTLVPCASMAGGADSEELSTESVELISRVGFDAASGGNGQIIIVDTKLSLTSTNPVENRVITAALNEKVSAAYVDKQLKEIKSLIYAGL